MENRRTEALAGTGTLEASTPSKPFLLRVLRLRQSQLGGWSRAAERLTIGQVTEAARREWGGGVQILLQDSQPCQSNSWER